MNFKKVFVLYESKYNEKCPKVKEVLYFKKVLVQI